VRRGDFVPHALLTGEIRPVVASDILVPRTPSWQVQIRWMEGDGADVAVGQKVIEFDNSSFSTNLEANRLAASRAANDLVRQKAQNTVTLAEKEFAKEAKRVAFEKASIDADIPSDLMSPRDYQDRQLARKRAQVELDKAHDELAAARAACEADLKVARIALEKAEREVRVAEEAIAALAIVAPRAGVLEIREHPWEGRKFQVGDSAWAGLAVMRIPDLSQVEVEARLYDVDDGQVRVGAPARCTLDAFPDVAIPGTVREVTAIAQETARNARRRVFRVIVALRDAPIERMRPGMSVRVEAQGDTQKAVLIAPRAALAPASSAARARLAGNQRVDVVVGPCSAQECVVLQGLSEGDRLLPWSEGRP
jgi:HlyD family secretion protein